MAATALVLGLIAAALATALSLALTLHLHWLLPFLVGAIFFAVCIALAVCIVLGLALSVLALVGRRGRTRVMPVAALAVNIVAFGAVIAVTTIVFSRGEPTLDEAMLQLVSESGVEVQRIWPGVDVRRLGPSRPALLVLPSGDYQAPLDQRPRIPLVLSLHGYSSHHMDLDSYFGMSRLVNSYNFALVLSNGTRDDNGNRFWNATDFCCGITDPKPDDVAYLTSLVEEAADHVNIDRVFVTGMSNGGFMSYRLACESLPGLAGIVVVAGSSFSDEARCNSASPVSVLHIHGTADEVIAFEGGANPDLGDGSYPAARVVIHRWARRAGCDLSVAERLPNLDMDRAVGGSETSVTRYRTGCRDGVIVEFWEMDSSSHVPRLADDFGERILDWLFGSRG